MADSIPSAVADETEVGSLFVANYPPFSVWTREAVAADARGALGSPAVAGVPLGLYLHIPFCRKRCHFCYFRVYTDKNAREVAGYLDTLVREWQLYADQPAIAGRPLSFVYFGGGTPSFLSIAQLQELVGGLSAVRSWRDAEEITFECEPGTLPEGKLAAIRELGVTRLSLGVENFDDGILERNGRAHRSAEIFRAWEAARALDFPQINLDLIAGMVGETDANWRACIEKTLELSPDSVTIYQLELPYNTTISKDILNHSGAFGDGSGLATWATKRRWIEEAFAALEAAGYHIGSAYTAVKDPSRTRFVYRDRLWQGADLVGLGVASFGHLNGVHVQNLDQWEPYSAAVSRGEIPWNRAYRPTHEERMIREFVLQLKRGWIRPSYFREKYDVDVLARFREPIASLRGDGYLSEAGPESVRLSRAGLLRADVLLKRFFLPQHVGLRYT
ncbi:MAG TPA: coproporphyrinogen-III oxidase family protein [Vicinamibacteria bacterium]|nr:coproporphyrinogen-III oxidase family protein [Vicinamibacteria bacterium]